ncbi:hypothetical protein M422DRAFT_159961 [Sphaerobolus stellatus SS14]|nr:hypothetical protein M422DRAFT_159961 [Sphaerobolus stellatus SS14]
MQEINPESLSSLESRIPYVTDFLDFGPEDAAALHAAKPVLAPLVSTIIDLVYDKLLSFTITAQSFVAPQTGYTGVAPTSVKDLSQEHPQIKFRKDFLAGYLVKLVSMDYGSPKSWEYLDKVARMHTGVTDSGFSHRKSKPGLRVEYIHCGLLLGYVEDIIVSEVVKHPELDTETKLAVIKAVNKILWIQNDLFARHYLDEKLEMPSTGLAKSTLLYSAVAIAAILIAQVLPRWK